MRILLAVFVFCAVAAAAAERTKRQVNYAFPGPRTAGRSRPNIRDNDADRDRSEPRHRVPQGFPQGFKPFSPSDFSRFQTFDGSNDERGPPSPPRRSRPPSPPRRSRPPPPPRRSRPPQTGRNRRPETPDRFRSDPGFTPVHRQPRPAPRPAPRERVRRPVETRRQRPVEPVYESEESEEETKIDPLTELLASSSFECSGKKSGYYADSSVDCQAFHYCTGGKKHSWMCQDGQIFHQVHLICVPGAGNDICKRSSDFEFVNDYLYKAVGKQKNVTIYADRYYPENYSIGDPIDDAPQEAPRARAPSSREPEYDPRDRPPPRSRQPPPRRQQSPPQNYAPRGRRPQQGYDSERPYFDDRNNF